MNKLLVSTLAFAVKESLSNYESREDSNLLTDLYLYHDVEDNSLTIYDDTNRVLNKVDLSDNPFFNLAQMLRQVFQQAGRERLFERDYIAKPFTVNLVDKDFGILEELYFSDDDTMKKNGTTWKDIEKDLDDFLKNLLQ